MQLICVANKFEQKKIVGIGPFKREETKSFQYDLTIGKLYNISVFTELEVYNHPSIAPASPQPPQGKIPALLVYDDNQRWIKITIRDVVVPEHLSNEDLINQLIKSVFEVPEESY